MKSIDSAKKGVENGVGIGLELEEGGERLGGSVCGRILGLEGTVSVIGGKVMERRKNGGKRGEEKDEQRENRGMQESELKSARRWDLDNHNMMTNGAEFNLNTPKHPQRGCISTERVDFLFADMNFDVVLLQDGVHVIRDVSNVIGRLLLEYSLKRDIPVRVGCHV